LRKRKGLNKSQVVTTTIQFCVSKAFSKLDVEEKNGTTIFFMNLMLKKKMEQISFS